MILLLAELPTLTRLAPVDHQTGLLGLWLVTLAVDSVLHSCRRMVTNGTVDVRLHVATLVLVELIGLRRVHTRHQLI